MKKVLFISFFNIFVLFSFLSCQNKKIYQKDGLYQGKTDKYLVFDRFDELKIANEEIVFKAISKVILHDGLLYILDSRQSKIFVVGPSGDLISIIGQPGQGPGDLEYPRDFYINSDGTIYVINSAAQRIEVFSQNGKFLKRINLAVPEDIIYSHLSGILLNQSNKLFITYNISEHLIDEYQDTGAYIKTLVKRNDSIKIPGVNIGNSSSIYLKKKNQDIIHFNYFTGIFTIISQKGIIKAEFSAYDSMHQNQMSMILSDINKSEKPILSIRVFELWSPFFCINNEGVLLAILMLKDKNEPQKFFVFSEEGKYLYQMSIPFFEGDIIDQIYFYDNTYIFITTDQKIYFSK